MWVWHACLSHLNGPCDPKSWADLAEMFLVFVAAGLLIPALLLFLEWIDSLF